MKLADIATFIKSNNAGAAYLTFDIGFPDQATFEAAVRSESINADSVAALYPYAKHDVQIFAFPPARVIKITIPRPTPSGGADERDFDGVQQYAPLLNLELSL
jgi:hypothetical protein